MVSQLDQSGQAGPSTQSNPSDQPGPSSRPDLPDQPSGSSSSRTVPRTILLTPRTEAGPIVDTIDLRDIEEDSDSDSDSYPWLSYGSSSDEG